MDSSQLQGVSRTDKAATSPIDTITDAQGHSSSPRTATSDGSLRVFVALFRHIVSLPTGLVRKCFTPKDTPSDSTHDDEATKPPNEATSTSKSHIRHQMLASLPPELLFEIIGYLEWSDILQVRKTCKVLNAASTSKGVWLNLYEELASQSMVKHKFDRPIEYITSRELEDTFFQRKDLMNGWTKAGLRRVRQLNILDEYAQHIRLVEGGRWLLVVTLSGSVLCHDLDDPDIKERELIPDQVNWNAGNFVAMDVDVNKEEELLTFNLAVSIKERFEGLHRLYSETFAYVWKVTLKLDENGRGVGLDATRLALFPLEKNGSIQSLSLLGTLLCYRLSSTSRQRLNYIAIVNWDEIGGDERQLVEEERPESVEVYKRRIIHIEKEPGNFRLVSGNQLVLALRNGIRLYKLNRLPLQNIHDAPPDQPNTLTEYSWSVDIPVLTYGSLSRPFIVNTTSDEGTIIKSTRLVICGARSIHGLIIPLDHASHAGKLLPYTVHLMDYVKSSTDCNYNFGYNRGVVRHIHPEVSLMQYSWPDDIRMIPPQVLRKKFAGKRWHRANPYIDEWSGRIVVAGTWGEPIVVLDTSLNGRTGIQ